MVAKIFKIASIIVVGLVASLIVLLICLIYFSPYENCKRSMRAENKGEAWAAKTCLWKHYMIGERPKILPIKNGVRPQTGSQINLSVGEKRPHKVPLD
jgi:hypothetical protein